MNKQEPRFKVLSPEEIQIVEHKASNEYKQSINHEQGKFLTYNLEMAIKKGICQAQLKDTLRQVVEMLDGMENPYIVILDVLNTKTMIQKAKSEGYDEAIQTIKQPLQQAIGEGAG